MSNANTPIDDDLLVKYLLGEVTPAEYILVENWISASTENRSEYERFKLIWDESQQIAAANVDEDAAYTRLHNRIHTNQPAQRQTPIRRLKTSHWIGLAASVVLICTVLWLTFNHVYDNGSISVVKIDSRGKVRTANLPDGSVITLNSHSTLLYPERFKGEIRPVSLQGEAFFKVAPDKSKPFIIKVNDVTVRVVGTSFNIKERNGKTEVIVETGIVKVSKKQSSVNLIPGERVTINKDEGVLSKEISKGKLYNYYLTGELICDHTPLAELVPALNEVYGAHIIIGNKALQNLPITTVFKKQSLDDVLTVIADTFEGTSKITVVRKGKQIILR
ncbi:FecR family protein [Mucilaginibacter pineti]|uniref:FecR family protein n=1 Tax=Mucilaginibacter pineti TaxID=1391627 RepID=A0A1G7FNI6_9SPHI|nr:FecR domain-containing protein [Mucilaginibacter pineti]SDE77491.1 FecR family protein [Mucilaginibacter pineti]